MLVLDHQATWELRGKFLVEPFDGALLGDPTPRIVEIHLTAIDTRQHDDVPDPKPKARGPDRPLILEVVEKILLRVLVLHGQGVKSNVLGQGNKLSRANSLGIGRCITARNGEHRARALAVLLPI